MKNIIMKFYKHFLIFVFSILVFNFSIDCFFKYQVQNYLSIKTDSLQTKYETQYKYLKIMSQDVFSMYQDNDGFIELLSEVDKADIKERDILRKKIYKHLKRRYRHLMKMGIKHITFYLPNNKTFLRMNKPSHYGDNVSNIRNKVVLTNSSRKANEGFYVDEDGHGFSYVYPLYSKNRDYLGCIEIFFDSTFLLQNVTGKTILGKHFLILKSEVTHKSRIDSIPDSYVESPESEDYFLTSDRVHDKHKQNLHNLFDQKSLYNEVKDELKQKISFSVDTKLNDDDIIITFVSIKESQRRVAYISLYIDSEYLHIVSLEEKYIKLLFFSIILLLSIFSVYVTLVHIKLRDMALMDKLTGLPNRAYFYTALESEIERVKRNKSNCSVLFIDLDGFKSVNDTFGHDAGDELLIQVSARLKENVREIDIVSRIGGDEFVILLTNMKNILDSAKVADKIIDALATTFDINKQDVTIGASIGISSYPDDALDIDTLVKNADDAMYKAKNNGKNHYVIYENEE